MAERNRPHACLDEDCLSDSDHACCGGPSCDVCHPRLTQGQPESAPLAHEIVGSRESFPSDVGAKPSGDESSDPAIRLRALISEVSEEVACLYRGPLSDAGILAVRRGDLLRRCLVALSAALPAQPHPETPQGEEAIRDGFVREAYEQMGRKCEEMCGRNCPEDRSCEETIVSLRQRIADLEASQPPPEALTLAALKNVGIDTACGACMEVAFTGVTTNAHTCRDAQTEALRALSQQWREVESDYPEDAVKAYPPKGVRTQTNEISVEVIVNGQPVDLWVSVDATAAEVIARASQQSGQVAAVERWALRDASQKPIDHSTRIGAVPAKFVGRLWMHLTVGMCSASPAPHTERTT